MILGLYPEDHDITGDVMYDLRSQNFFMKGDFSKTRKDSWWESVNPFWSTAAGSGRKVAFFNWHDCQIPGKFLENPSDCLPYPSIGPSNNSIIDSYDSDSPLPFIPSHTSIAQQADEAFTKIHKDKYDMSVVSSITLHHISFKISIYNLVKSEINNLFNFSDADLYRYHSTKCRTVRGKVKTGT